MSPAVIDSEINKIHADRKSTVEFAQKRAKYRRQKLQEAAAVKTDELQQICLSLLKIAQQYVPNNAQAFSAVTEIVNCTKMLQRMGVAPHVMERFKAAVDATGNEMVLKSADYRDLRNKYIAGLATIADLTEKPAAVGSLEFQKGVREGYRRASDIAVLFLEDVTSGEQKC